MTVHRTGSLCDITTDNSEGNNAFLLHPPQQTTFNIHYSSDIDQLLRDTAHLQYVHIPHTSYPD